MIKSSEILVPFARDFLHAGDGMEPGEIQKAAIHTQDKALILLMLFDLRLSIRTEEIFRPSPIPSPGINRSAGFTTCI